MTERVAGFIYVGGWLAIWVAGATYAGYMHQRGERGYAADLMPPLLFGSFLWPLAVLAAVLSLPWWAGAAVGKVAGLREARRDRMRADEREALTRLRDAFDRDEPEWALLNQKIRSMT